MLRSFSLQANAIDQNKVVYIGNKRSIVRIISLFFDDYNFAFV